MIIYSGIIALAAPPITNGEGLAIYICMGPVASLRSEAAGPLSILQKEELYNGHFQLMIFPDCLMLLSSCQNGGKAIFGLFQASCSYSHVAAMPLAAILQVYPLDFLRNMRGGNTSRVAV